MKIEELQVIQIIEALRSVETNANYNLHNRLVELGVTKVPLNIGEFWRQNAEVLITTSDYPLFLSDYIGRNNITYLEHWLPSLDFTVRASSGVSSLIKDFGRKSIFVCYRINFIEGQKLHFFEENDPITLYELRQIRT